MAFNFNALQQGYVPQPFPTSLPNPPTAGPSQAPHMSTAGPSSTSGSDEVASAIFGDPRFQIFDWYPLYQSCQRYFLDHAQYEGSVQALAALINIRLPYQWTDNPVMNSLQPAGPQPGSGHWQPGPPNRPGPPTPGSHAPWVSLIPYIRRLVITGMDKEGILHGFFGSDWVQGVGPFQECERRNYLFSAKGIGMVRTKAEYDMNPHETVPFMKPLDNVREPEMQQADKVWSDALRMEDWMLGARAPDRMQAERDDNRSSRS